MKGQIGVCFKKYFLMYHNQITPTKVTPKAVIMQFVEANKRFDLPRWSVDEDMNFTGKLTVSIKQVLCIYNLLVLGSSGSKLS